MTKEFKKENILFLNDGSILNPIIHSQGLPLLKYLSDTFNCRMLSFEFPFSTEKEKEQYNYISKKYNKYIDLKEVSLKNNSFIPYLIVFFVKGIPKVTYLIIKYNIKLLHMRSLFPSVIGLSIKLFYPGIKIIYDNRGVLIEELIYQGIYKRGSFKEWVFRKLEYLILSKSDHIVVVSNVFKVHLIKKYPIIKNFQDKISVINNKARIEKVINPEKLGDKKDKNKIICIYSGSSAKWQNIPKIFSFAMRCHLKFDNFRLKVITYHSEEVKKILVEYGALLKITEIIEVNSDKVLEHLITANFSLLFRDDNIINNVSSPLKFAEYLSAGLPVVVSKGVGDTEEVINKYKVGVILEEDNYELAIVKLIELLKDRDIYRRCRIVAEKEFNLEDSFISYKSIYTSLLEV